MVEIQSKQEQNIVSQSQQITRAVPVARWDGS